MTKRKAIDDAMTRLRQEARVRELYDEHDRVTHEGYPTPGSIISEMDAIWEHARVAGLREAAKIAKGSMAFGDVKILDRAETLAKKARAK